MKRIVQHVLLLCLPVLAACASQGMSKVHTTIHIVSASNDTVKFDQADAQEVDNGVKMIEAGRIQAAIDGPFDDVVNRYEAKYGKSKHKIYSARGMTDGLLYSMLAGSAKPPVDVDVIGPAWARAYWGRGYAYNEMARYDDAIVELRKALALAPYDAQYEVELAYAYDKKNDWKQSLALYRSVLDYVDITTSDVPGMKCRALRGQGYDLVELHRLVEADAAYRACLKIKPGESKSLEELEYIRQVRAKASKGDAGK